MGAAQHGTMCGTLHTNITGGPSAAAEPRDQSAGGRGVPRVQERAARRAAGPISERQKRSTHLELRRRARALWVRTAFQKKDAGGMLMKSARARAVMLVPPHGRQAILLVE